MPNERPMTGIDLNLLGALDALLGERSVTGAARRLGVSQPTMSGILSRLRQQLDDPLLVRVGRTMELTPRAIGLVDEVRQLRLMAERLHRPDDVIDPSRITTHFRIMASEYGMFLILPTVFRRAARLAPEATFETVQIEQPAASVYSGAVDLCLTGDMMTEVVGEMAAQVRTQTLMNDIFVGIVDRDHPLSGAVTLEELLAYPHVATQFAGSHWTVEDVGLSDLSRRHPPRIKVASFLALGQLVAATRGIGIVPAGLAPLMTADNRLRTLALPSEFSPIAVRLLWHARLDRDPTYRWLRGLIADACRTREDPAGSQGR
jgi:LysR family nod box-dependent transcriptional activator